MYVAWEIIYLIPNLYFLNKVTGITLLSILNYFRLLILGEVNRLWYFMSLIYCIIIINIFLRYKKIKLLSIFSVLLLFVGAIATNYYNLISNTFIGKIMDLYVYIFNSPRAGICFGIPYLTAGILINKLKINKKIKRQYILLIVAMVFFVVESSIVKKYNWAKECDMYFTTIFLVSIIVIILLNNNIKVSSKTSKLLKQLSIGIYCSHDLFLSIYTKGLIIVNVIDKPYANLLIFIFTTISSIGLTLLIRKSKIKILKNLI